MFNSKSIVLTSVLLGAAKAHMFISSPAPIEGSAPKSPLDASGSNFPCHGITLPTSGGHTMAAGSNQTLSFDLGNGANTAVHGGGSCQISITYETEASKLKDPGSWRVIYSIEGGCPTDAKGNLDNGGGAVACTGDNGPNCVNSFPFTIPQGVKNGHAIMAWTWFNAVGNREIYMNCVNAEISGGDGSEMGQFPEMFVANLASVNQCGTAEDTNVKFPDPGKYVTTKTQGNPYPLAAPTGQGCPAGSGSYSHNNNNNDQAHPPAANSSSVAATTMSSSTIAPPPTSMVAPQQPHRVPSSSSSAAPPAASTGTSKGNTCTGPAVSCPTPGQTICVDAHHFGICDTDNCAIPQPVAPGTACQNGSIVQSQKKRAEGKYLRSRISGRRYGHRKA